MSCWYLQAYSPAYILREKSPVKPPLFHFIGEVVNFFSKKNDPVWANALYQVKKLYPNKLSLQNQKLIVSFEGSAKAHSLLFAWRYYTENIKSQTAPALLQWILSFSFFKPLCKSNFGAIPILISRFKVSSCISRISRFWWWTYVLCRKNALAVFSILVSVRDLADHISLLLNES